MTEQAEVLDQTFTGRLTRCLKAWFVLWGALIPAVLAAFLGLGLVARFHQLPSPTDGWALVAGVVVSVPLALMFSLLGLPFLVLRRWIVRPKAPFIRPGYLAVVLYGPALWVMIPLADDPAGYVATMASCFTEAPSEPLMVITIYEVIAGLATILFAWAWRSLGMFEVDAAIRARRGSEPGKASSPVTTPGL